MNELWTEYDVVWTFIRKLCGSVPGNPHLLETVLKARSPKVRPPGGKSIPEIQEEIVATLEEEEEEPAVNVFQKVNNHLVVRSDNIRAHIKECARIVTWHYVGYVQGEKSLTARTKNCVYIDDYFIQILRPDGKLVADQDGRITKPIHTSGPRGQPINAIKTFEWIEPARLDFHLRVFGGVVKVEDLKTIMEYGGVHGFGGERSAGEGKYIFKIIERGKDNGRKTAKKA